MNWLMGFFLMQACILGATEAVAFQDSLMLKVVLLEKEIMENQHSEERKVQLVLKKADTYKRMNRPYDALATLSRLQPDSLSGSVKCTVHYNKALHAFMVGLHSTSLQEVWSMDQCSMQAPQEMLFLMVLLENDRWDDFKSSFLTYARSRHFDTTSFVKEFRFPELMDVDRYRKKSVWPGAGLISSGHTGKGIVNISLQLAFAGFAVSQFYTGYYFTGFFSGVQPARRFYKGGRALTQTLVHEENHERIDDLKAKGYKYISQLYQ